MNNYPVTTKKKRKVKLPTLNEIPIETLKQARKLLAKVAHPDVNGNNELMSSINTKYDQLMEMENNTTHFEFILDNSGSMQNNKHQAIDSYNKILNQQLQLRGNPTIGLSTFDTIGQPQSISKDIYLTSHNYKCHGNTPLYDTIGAAISNIDNTLNNPKDVIVIIITDGGENASRNYNPSNLQPLIKQKMEIGWQFIYCSCGYRLGGNDALKIGIPPECVANFQTVNELFSKIGSMLIDYRQGNLKQLTFTGK